MTSSGLDISRGRGMVDNLRRGDANIIATCALGKHAGRAGAADVGSVAARQRPVHFGQQTYIWSGATRIFYRTSRYPVMHMPLYLSGNASAGTYLQRHISHHISSQTRLAIEQGKESTHTQHVSPATLMHISRASQAHPLTSALRSMPVGKTQDQTQGAQYPLSKEYTLNQTRI